MNISTNNNNGITHVELGGRMDMQGTQDIDLQFTSVANGDGSAVVADMSGVEFIASIGIRTLLSHAKTISARGGSMAICNCQDLVGEVLQTAGIPALIPICATFDEARQFVLENNGA